MKRWKIIISVLLFTGISGAVAVAIVPHSPIPSNISKEVPFTILYPHSGEYKVDRRSFKYDQGIELLSFKLMHGDVAISFNEQKTPASFTRQALDFQLKPFRHRQDFETELGKMTLVDSDKNGEIAVLPTRSVLFLMQSDQPIGRTGWQKIVDLLKESR